MHKMEWIEEAAKQEKQQTAYEENEMQIINTEKKETKQIRCREQNAYSTMDRSRCIYLDA